MKWTEKINIAANIATIIGVLVGVIALVYAYLQYNNYQEELGKMPDLTLDVFFTGLLKDQMVTFPNNSSHYSNVLPLRIKIKNVGTTTTKQVDLQLAFNDNQKIVGIEYHISGIEPILNHQLFVFRNMSFPLPQEFPGIPLMTMSIRLKKFTNEHPVYVGRFTIYSGGGQGKTKGIYFNPVNERFF